jgi:hypothetical protein
MCITYRVFLDDGDKLRGSTLLYTILVGLYYFLRLDVLCVIDSPR